MRVATAVAAAERSIDSCNAKQSNEPCCALYDRLDTSLYTICCTVHVVSERVFRCNVSCDTVAIVITLFCFFFAFNAFFLRAFCHSRLKTIFIAMWQIVKVRCSNEFYGGYTLRYMYNDFSSIQVIMQSQKFYSYYTLCPRRPLSVITCISVETQTS